MKNIKYNALSLLIFLLISSFFLVAFIPTSQPNNSFNQSYGSSDKSLQEAAGEYLEISELVEERALEIADQTLSRSMSTQSEIKEFEKKELEKKLEKPGIIIKYRSDSEALKIVKNNSNQFNNKTQILNDKELLSIKVPVNMSLEEALEFFKNRKDIEYVEEDLIRKSDFIPNDTYYNDYQYNLGLIGAEAGWNISMGGSSNIIVAVIDTGVAYEEYDYIYHLAPDFNSSTFVQGYDFATDDSHPNDTNGHGTGVASIIAAATNNNFGMAGISYNVRIMPVRVAFSDGTIFLSDEIAGFYWAVDNGARVINFSGAGAVYSTSEQTAVQYAKSHNVFFVCSSGNSGGQVQYPAAYPEAIAVGSVNQSKNWETYSCYGSSLDFVAPGRDILTQYLDDYFGDIGWYYVTGTSFSAPQVAGLAALILSMNSSLTVDQVKNYIINGCEDLGASGFDNYYGYGLINILNSLTTVQNINHEISDFSTRFYTLCLGRPPDPSGLSYWTNALMDGSKTGEDIGYSFVMSDEYKAKNTTDSSFVTMLYNLFLDRPTDPEGLAFWQERLTRATRPGVLNGFIHSAEFSSICNSSGITAYRTGLPGFVNRFYTLTLERLPDEQGLSYWVDLLSTGDKTGADIAYGFVFSPEFITKNHSNAKYISILYSAFFDRVPDSDGFNYWTSQLNSGKSRQSILDRFIASQEFIGVCDSYGIVPY